MCGSNEEGGKNSIQTYLTKKIIQGLILPALSTHRSSLNPLTTQISILGKQAGHNQNNVSQRNVTFKTKAA
jgi:hypothetical protein